MSLSRARYETLSLCGLLLVTEFVDQVKKMIFLITTLPLSSKHRVSQITFHHSKPFLAVQSHDRSVEIFRIRTEEEVRKKQARRRKRAKEKKEQAQEIDRRCYNRDLCKARRFVTEKS